jgi:glycosyltransferase involved in cell wall biosynthesis
MSELSIITITNRPGNLDSLAEQVLNQELKPSEHIIVLDHELKNTNQEKLEEYLSKIPRKYNEASVNLKVVWAEEDTKEVSIYEKLARMRNQGFKESTGEYVCFWDDDNKFLAQHTKGLLDLAKKLEAQTPKKPIVVHSWRKLVDQDGNPVPVNNTYPWNCKNPGVIMARLKKEDIFKEGSNVVRDKIYGKNNTVDTNLYLFSRSAISLVGGWIEEQTNESVKANMSDDGALGEKLAMSIEEGEMMYGVV